MPKLPCDGSKRQTSTFGLLDRPPPGCLTRRRLPRRRGLRLASSINMVSLSAGCDESLFLPVSSFELSMLVGPVFMRDQLYELSELIVQIDATITTMTV